MMIKQKIVTAVLVAVGMFTASACTNTARQEQATTEPTQPTAQPSQPATGQGQSTTGSNQNALSSSEREFVTQVVQDSMAEVQLGQLASQRALRDEVKQFGQRMVRDHTQVHNELKQLAAQKGITLPAASLLFGMLEMNKIVSGKRCWGTCVNPSYKVSDRLL
jgi:putative membrane protein